MSTASFCHFRLSEQRVTTSKRDRKRREAIMTLEHLTATEHSPPWAMDLLFGFLSQPSTEVRLAYMPLPDGDIKPIAWIAYRWNAKWNLEVHRIAVRPGYRRQGIGRWLLSSAAESGQHVVYSEVPERDLHSQLFMKSCGFRCTHIMEQREEDGGDCYLFVLRINSQNGNCTEDER